MNWREFYLLRLFPSMHNWNIPQVVTVTGVDDDPPVSDGAADYIIITGNVSSTDDNYGSLDGTTVVC